MELIDEFDNDFGDELGQYDFQQQQQQQFEFSFLERMNLLKSCCIDVVWQTAISARFVIFVAFLCHVLSAHFSSSSQQQSIQMKNLSAKQQQKSTIFAEKAPFLAHFLLGLAGVYVHFDNNLLPVVSLLGETLIFYAIRRFISANNRLRNLICTCFIICFTCLMEFVLFPAELWHAIRGCHMILAMKLISLLDSPDDDDDDDDKNGKKQESSSSFLSYFGYCLSPATVIYGPWLSYGAFLHSVRTAKIDLQQWIHVGKNVIFGVICLVCSTCVLNGILFSDEDISKHLIGLRDSYSFILSHFFVSYLSTVIATMGGATCVTLDLQRQKEPSYVVVSRPFDVLVPHSLTQLVIAWSMPMHTWLRRYIFRPMHRNFGPLAGVLSTYTASALLHGFNAQIAVVLLTVGVFTYVEFRLRSRLAKIFDACISSRPCEDNERDPVCHHKYDLDQPAVRGVNVAFAFYTVALFAYATACFGTDTEHGTAVEGYSFLHLIAIWSRMNWYGHILCLVTFIFDYATR